MNDAKTFIKSIDFQAGWVHSERHPGNGSVEPRKDPLDTTKSVRLIVLTHEGKLEVLDIPRIGDYLAYLPPERLLRSHVLRRPANDDFPLETLMALEWEVTFRQGCEPKFWSPLRAVHRGLVVLMAITERGLYPVEVGRIDSIRLVSPIL